MDVTLPLAERLQHVRRGNAGILDLKTTVYGYLSCLILRRAWKEMQEHCQTFLSHLLLWRKRLRLVENDEFDHGDADGIAKGLVAVDQGNLRKNVQLNGHQIPMLLFFSYNVHKSKDVLPQLGTVVLDHWPVRHHHDFHPVVLGLWRPAVLVRWHRGRAIGEEGRRRALLVMELLVLAGGGIAEAEWRAPLAARKDEIQRNV